MGISLCSIRANGFLNGFMKPFLHKLICFADSFVKLETTKLCFSITQVCKFDTIKNSVFLSKQFVKLICKVGVNLLRWHNHCFVLIKIFYVFNGLF